MGVKFQDYTIQVKAAIESVADNVLEEVAGELESKVKRKTAVDTGQTKNSWTHRVRSDGDLHEAVIGSPMENAIWEEFGTGEHALNGDGRKGGWSYKDEKGNWHHTMGKHPRRPFWKAYTALKNKLIKHIQDAIKGALK